jgi:uncharacterized damage-inducible protein DinB
MIGATRPTEELMADSVDRVITTDALLAHWQGHRRLTRRLIDAFPEDRLFDYSVGGMRSFGEMAMELLSMGAPMARGVATGEWNTSWDRDPLPKAELIEQWDASSAEIDRLWAQIPAERFQEKLTAFGQYEGIVHDLLLYVIDNEIHHRAQGYVYLRSLGIDPPHFWERSAPAASIATTESVYSARGR